MPRYDLNGDPMPEEAAPAPQPAQAPPAQQYDLAGNPMPARPQQPVAPQPVGAGQPMGQPGGYGIPPQQTYQPGYTQQQQAARKPTTTFDGKEYKFSNPSMNDTGNPAVKILIAAAIGLTLSILGSIGIMKLLASIGMGFGLIYVALGWGVGFVMSFASKNKGITVGITSLLLAVGLFIGHVTYTADMLHKAGADGTPVMAAFGTVMGAFPPMHWILILVAFSAGLRGAASDVGGD